jgi:hypothetical protein
MADRHFTGVAPDLTRLFAIGRSPDALFEGGWRSTTAPPQLGGHSA